MTNPEVSSAQSLLTQLSAKNPQLATHLTHVLAYILRTRPSNPFHQFEIISAQFKAGKLPLASIDPFADEKNNTETNAINKELSLPIKLQHVVTACEEMEYLLGKKRPKPKKEVNEDEDAVEDEEEEEVPEIPATLPNLSQQFSLLRQSGVQLSNDEICQIEAGMLEIINREENSASTETINFWGKFHTLTKDYYIIEMKKSEYDEDEFGRLMKISMNNTGLNAQKRTQMAAEETEDSNTEDDHHEALGVGANEYVYYCTSTLHELKSWQLLPYVTPLHICLSRTSRRYLTGDLEAPVYGFPRFLGKEMHLVRALIARISHGTRIAPIGAYIRDETEDVVIVNEAFSGVVGNKLQSTEAWQHIRMNLLQEGRTDPWVDEEAEAEEEENDENSTPKKEKEPIIPLLRSCAKDVYSKDTPVSLRITLSTVQDTGFILPTVDKDDKPYNDEEEETESPKEKTHILAIARSNVWPGAMTVSKGAHYNSIYIGWGLKSTTVNDAFVPTGPQALQSEYSGDLIEQVDAQPNEEQRKQEAEYQIEQLKDKEQKLEEADEEDDNDDLELDMEDEAESADGNEE